MPGIAEWERIEELLNHVRRHHREAHQAFDGPKRS
jgi:hypothetical protein